MTIFFIERYSSPTPNKTLKELVRLWCRFAEQPVARNRTTTALAALDCDRLADIGAQNELEARRAISKIDARTMTYLMSLR